MKNINRQKGVTVIEFSLVASTLILLVFAIIEIGYFTFSLQALNDLTRRAARIATVCQVSDGDIIKNLALSEYVPKNFTSENIEINYLSDTGGPVTDILDPNASIHYVSAKVVRYTYGFSGILNFLGENGVITVPNFETILAAESLGVGRLDPSSGDGIYIDCK